MCPPCDTSLSHHDDGDESSGAGTFIYEGRLLQGLQIAQRLLQGLDLPAVLGEVAGLQRRLGVVVLPAGDSKMLEAYGLCAMLPKDDPVVPAQLVVHHRLAAQGE